MQIAQKSKCAIRLFLSIVMLNSIAVWAFSFLSFGQLALIYLINLFPILLLVFYMRAQTKKKANNAGFIFLFFVLIKILYLFLFLLSYNYFVGLSQVFLINFIFVYLSLLYLSIFVGIGFLSKK